MLTTIPKWGFAVVQQHATGKAFAGNLLRFAQATKILTAYRARRLEKLRQKTG
jgi:hypothetical protein